MRDWIIIIGTLLILIVLFDGVRRTRNARYGNIRMSPAMKKRLKQQKLEEQAEITKEPSFTSELPNGGARVIGRRDKSSDDVNPIAQQEPAKRKSREPKQESLNLDDSVPLLMEEFQDPKKASALGESGERIEPTFSSSSHVPNTASQENDEYEGEDFDESESLYEEELEYDREREGELEGQAQSLDEEEYDEDILESDDIEADDYEESDDDYQEAASTQVNSEPDEVLIINVMAHKGEMLNGADLLDILLKCGLRYGDMDIFHRYTDMKGEGSLVFSLANMVKPGTFDLDAMDEFETPGVSLFMTLPLKSDSIQSFELMVDTAKAIADTLGGELKDEQRSVMTKQTIEHCRQRILDFERRRLFQRSR